MAPSKLAIVAGVTVGAGVAAYFLWKSQQCDTVKNGKGKALTDAPLHITQGAAKREVIVRMPSEGEGPFPVLVLLHGIMQDAQGIIKMFEECSDLQGIFKKYAILAPQGDQKSWNISDEPSKMDDVAFIKEVIDVACSHSNIDGDLVHLYGFSNGAALVNRILIENDDPRITKAVADASQLNASQFQQDSFRRGGDDNSYTQKQVTMQSRSLLFLQGAKDNLIPAMGGKSGLPSGLQFLSAEESLFRYAKAYGFARKQKPMEAHEGGDKYVQYMLPSGDHLSSYILVEAKHGSLKFAQKQIGLFLL